MPPSLPHLLISHWSLSLLPTVYGCAAALLYLTGVSRSRRPWPLHRTACFLAGIGSVWVALESGLDAYDGRLLSVHMVQHLILLVIAPVLLLCGRPTLLVLRTVRPSLRWRLGRSLVSLRAITRPAGCLLTFFLVVLATHIPAFYDATLASPALHEAEHMLYLLSGLLLWWPVLGGDPAPSRRLDGLLQLAYVNLAMLPMEAIGIYLTRATTVVYAPYRLAARGLGINALTDQAHAGGIMWVWGGVVMAIAVVWSSMHAMVQEERRLQAVEGYAAPASPPQAARPGGVR
ncbi:MAG TPA: cytochrome c oxidase assembly protein [Solirubrobacteraceae bacterium]|nr:cytochrome c oxidase assembly protein [Solirubrobacteraceae bacterium]